MMKFIASDVEAAKAKARRAFGEGAYILSVRNLPSGDVEVSASDRPAPAAPAAPVDTGFARAAQRAVDENAIRPANGARLSEPIEQKFSEDALSRLSSDLSGARRKGVSFSTQNEADLAAILQPHGLGERLLEALMSGARKARIDDELYRLETGFAEVFDFAPLRPSPTSPIMLVGPTGAGKTSCAAKLAAKAMDEQGAAFMMTADVGRAGAIDQLKTYGDTLGADYYIVETPADVMQALRAKRPSGAVILDTPGVSPYDVGDIAALKSFQQAAAAEAVLVLPASGDAAEYVDWAEAFAEFGVKRMVITKFDATKRVGAALTAAHAGRMTLANFSETPFISEGLREASAEFLSRRLLATRPGQVAG